MKKAIEVALKTTCIMCHKEFSDDLLRIWEIGLEGYTVEQITAATKRYCKKATSTFMPTPATFINFSDDGSAKAQNMIEETKQYL